MLTTATISFPLMGFFIEWLLANTRCVLVIMGSTLAKLCRIETVPADFALKTTTNTVDKVQGMSCDTVTVVLSEQHGKVSNTAYSNVGPFQTRRVRRKA